MLLSYKACCCWPLQVTLFALFVWCPQVLNVQRDAKPLPLYQGTSEDIHLAVVAAGSSHSASISRRCAWPLPVLCAAVGFVFTLAVAPAPWLLGWLPLLPVLHILTLPLHSLPSAEASCTHGDWLVAASWDMAAGPQLRWQCLA